MANREATLIKVNKRLDKEAIDLGLEINESKTKYMGQAIWCSYLYRLITQKH